MNIFILKDKNNTSAGYIQVTEEELQAYKRNSEEKVYLINLGHSIMETDEANFRAFYKERRREKYLREEAQLAGGVISLNAIDSEELDGVGVVVDTSEPLDENKNTERNYGLQGKISVWFDGTAVGFGGCGSCNLCSAVYIRKGLSRRGYGGVDNHSRCYPCFRLWLFQI